jgi:uncharacterized protein YqjF (DUF2071 family)
MRDVRPVGLPAVPNLSHFLETNVRTYVVGPNGESGVWFYSLDASNTFACKIARATFGLPYFPALMRYEETSEFHTYRCHRRGSNLKSEITAHPHGPVRTATFGSLEHFLLERYQLFAIRRGKVMSGQVFHSPYEFQDCDCQVQDELLSAAGFASIPSLGAAPFHSVFSAGVDVRIGAPRKR